MPEDCAEGAFELDISRLIADLATDIFLGPGGAHGLENTDDSLSVLSESKAGQRNSVLICNGVLKYRLPHRL